MIKDKNKLATNIEKIKNLNWRRIMVRSVVFALMFVVYSHGVFAAKEGPTSAGAEGRIGNPLKGTDSLASFFDGIVTVCIELGAIISVLGIMYGGFLYATAQGNEEQLGKAYKTITWALVGTAVLLGARTLMKAVTSTVEELGKGV
jgi:Type IV secretion system pilin